MKPVLLSGGSGTRLWPVSRQTEPKQFCEIFDENLQSLSLKRVSQLGRPLILTSEALKVLTEKQLKNFSADVLYEPLARNTAPAIAFLCRSLQIQNMEQEIVGLFPSDHLIHKEEVFIQSVKKAEAEAQKGFVVTLGISPSHPETGYGYIRLQKNKLLEATEVLGFFEKPDFQKAEEYIRSGDFVWNAGIFVFKVQTMIQHLQACEPEIWNEFAKWTGDSSALKNLYPRLKSISIDYAVMERLNPQQIKCIPVDMGWSDVGSWDAVAEVSDVSGVSLLKNRVTDDGNLIEIDSRNNFIKSHQEKKTALIGVEDLLVIDTEDALLISKKGQSQKIKQVVDLLAKKADPVVIEKKKSQRPWGTYEILRDENNFKSKVIHVDPGQQISYQSHSKREEFWIITEGVGEVIINDQTTPIQKASSIHIPIGAKHRIRNTGSGVLQFVEVQLGSYFGEDDIIRYQDDYQRV